jgi:hypothetical protein
MMFAPLLAMGFRPRGYDHYYFPPALRRVVDVVTLIYVQGSIEIPRVRCEILSSAYQLTRQTQVASAITPAIGLPIGQLLTKMARLGGAVPSRSAIGIPNSNITQTFD